MYHLIIIPIVAVTINQIIKLIIDAKKNQFSWTDLNSYGGMPSSHTAMTVSLTAAVGYLEGWTSAAFAIALIFTIITIRDAIGFRKQLGLHAKIINKLIEKLPSEENFQFPHLKERLGHKPLEAFVGAAIGLLITVIYTLIFI